MILARHLGYANVDTMLDHMTPHEHDEWVWSLEYDPPAETRIDELLSRLEWRVAHLMAMDAETTPFAEWRTQWGQQFPDDDPPPDDTHEEEAEQGRRWATGIFAAAGVSHLITEENDVPTLEELGEA